jgi:transposase InsO family protein
VTWECLAAIPDTSISGRRRAARELTMLLECRGKPGMIVPDNGTEFTSNAMLAWAQDNRIVWRFIAPGKPMQNGFCESFNGRMRDESLFLGLMLGQDHELDRRLQPAASALGAGLSHTGGLCRQSLRNMRSAAQLGPALTSSADRTCSTRAQRRKTRRGSNRRPMKLQWQVKARVKDSLIRARRRRPRGDTDCREVGVSAAVVTGVDAPPVFEASERVCDLWRCF